MSDEASPATFGAVLRCRDGLASLAGEHPVMSLPIGKLLARLPYEGELAEAWRAVSRALAERYGEPPAGEMPGRRRLAAALAEAVGKRYGKLPESVTLGRPMGWLAGQLIYGEAARRCPFPGLEASAHLISKVLQGLPDEADSVRLPPLDSATGLVAALPLLLASAKDGSGLADWLPAPELALLDTAVAKVLRGEAASVEAAFEEDEEAGPAALAAVSARLAEWLQWLEPNGWWRTDR